MGLKSALFWFGFMIALALGWWVFDFPPEDEMIEIVRAWLTQYGLLAVLVGSFLEALFLVGIYFPGSLVIFMSVALAPSPSAAVLTVLAVSLGMFLAYCTNYALGRYGWYRLLMRLGMRTSVETAQTKLVENDSRYVLYTFWHPGLAAFTSTAAGIVRLPLRRFLFLIITAVIGWNTFWGVTVYTLGETALQLFNLKVMLTVLGCWVLFEVGRVAWRRVSTR